MILEEKRKEAEGQRKHRRKGRGKGTEGWKEGVGGKATGRMAPSEAQE